MVNTVQSVAPGLSRRPNPTEWRKHIIDEMHSRVKLDDQQTQWEPTLMLSVLLGRREGNFVMAPQARSLIANHWQSCGETRVTMGQPLVLTAALVQCRPH